MNLHWLPKNPEFGKQLNQIKSSDPQNTWTLLTALAQFDLNFLETLQVDKVLTEKFSSAPPDNLATKPIRLAILSSCTVDQLLPGIRVAALRRNLWVSIYLTDYDQSLQELSNLDSGLYKFKPTAVLCSFDAISLFGTQPLTMTQESAERKLEEALERMRTLWKQSKEKFGCQVIQQTPLPLFLPLMGNNEQRLFDSPSRLVRLFNERLSQIADEQKVDILNLDEPVAREGLDAWHNPALWHKAKQEITPAAGTYYGDLVGRLLAAQQGRSFKCLVLDLDNTLWGGVIGDDGLEGIQLGQGGGVGESYVAFQRYARDLARRGVILAVCSKNNEAAALEPFERHPEMILKRSDIACFIANWNDKASNIKEIAKQLNIGLDSMVFVDDNPFERNQVRGVLPMVAVPEMTEDPALYPACIAAAGYFEAVALTADDLARSEQYQKNLERSQYQTSFTDMSEYLKSLEMELVWGPFDTLSLTRVTQLINKTNQFNLMTRRYTEEQVAQFAANPKAVTLRLRLLDRFGDNGIIGIVVALPDQGGDYLVDTWLMSCRVLGRGVEQATLDLLIREASSKGAKRLIGQYMPTAKNDMVKAHYKDLGFEFLDEGEKGYTRWILNLNPVRTFDYFIKLRKGD